MKTLDQMFISFLFKSFPNSQNHVVVHENFPFVNFLSSWKSRMSFFKMRLDVNSPMHIVNILHVPPRDICNRQNIYNIQTKCLAFKHHAIPYNSIQYNPISPDCRKCQNCQKISKLSKKYQNCQNLVAQVMFFHHSD